MSDIELEGKITQVHERLPHTTQKGKESTKQLIVLSVKGVAIKIFCYGIDDLSSFRDTLVRISGLSESFKKDGSYMANFKTEFDDRVDSDITDDEHLSYGVKDGVGAYTEEEVKKKVEEAWEPVTKLKKEYHDRKELSNFTITVTRSKDYQSITLSEEFTGSFTEIDHYWTALDEKAKSLLLRMPKL